MAPYQTCPCPQPLVRKGWCARCRRPLLTGRVLSHHQERQLTHALAALLLRERVLEGDTRATSGLRTP